METSHTAEPLSTSHRGGPSSEQQTLRPRTELSREKDVYKYLNAWASLYRPTALYRHAFPAEDQPLPTPEPCGDTALTSIAQLCALRLKARRCLITLISSGMEYVLTEATRTMSMQYDTYEDTRDVPWIGCSSFPRTDGINDLAIDHWRKARQYRESPATPDTYFTQGYSPHYMVVSDTKNHKEYSDRAFVQRATNLRFFCSVPLRDANGSVLGSLTIMDDTPRYGVSAAQMLFLEDSADTVTSQLDTAVVRSRQQSSERLIQALGLFNNHQSSLREWWIGQDNERLRRGGRYHAEDERADNRQTRLDDEFGIQGSYDRAAASLRRLRREGSPDESRAEDAPQHMSQTTETNMNADNARTKQSVSATDFAAGTDKDTSSDSTKAAKQDRNGYTTSDDSIHNKDTSKSFDIARSISHAYARASNLICEAMRTEGVLFVDAKAASATLKKPSNGKPVTNPADFVSSHSDTGPSSLSDENFSDHGPATKFCRIAGFATRNSSSLHGSKAFSSRRLALQEAELQSFIKRYRRGKVFNFADSGDIYSSSGEDPSAGSSEDVSQASNPAVPRKTRASRDAARLGKIMDGAQTIAFLPIWDDAADSYSSCIFVWSTTPLRFFDAVEDLTYMAAFSHSLTAEIARLEAVASDAAKGNFISSVSHELRSPLHGVLAGAELLQDTELSSFQQDMISTITMAGRALLDTVNHVLDYAKISSRPADKKKGSRNQKSSSSGVVTVDLASLTENVVETVVSAHRFQRSLMPTSIGDVDSSRTWAKRIRDPTAANENEVAIVLSIGKQDSWITNMSRGSFTRIISNLLGNALKYTKAGVITVTLSANKVDSETAAIELVIEDTGIGMSEHFLSTDLFVPYRQVDHHSIGTGLGLSIVKQIAKDLNARMDVQSTLGRGTRISLAMDIDIVNRNADDIDHADSELMGTAANLSEHTFHMLSIDSSTTHTSSMASKAVSQSVTKITSEWFGLSVTSTSALDDSIREGVCAVVESDLLHLAKAEPKSLAAMMNDLATNNIRLLVLGCSLQPTLSGISFDDFPMQPTFVPQPIGPRKLLRVLSKGAGSGSSYEPTSSSFYDTTPDLATPLTLRRNGDVSAEDESFPWHSGAMSHAPPGRGLVAVRGPARNKPGAGGGRKNKQGSTATSTTTSASSRHTQDDSDSEHASTVSSSASSGAIVMLVEDNPINMRLLKVLMQKLDFPYDTADNGAEALAMFVTDPGRFFLILTDISMPVMDGNEATAKIREVERRQKLPRTKIVAITGVTSAASRSASFAAGVDDYFTKPVKMRDISALLARIRPT